MQWESGPYHFQCSNYGPQSNLIVCWTISYENTQSLKQLCASFFSLYIQSERHSSFVLRLFSDGGGDREE